jgi:hypothetical protein
MSYKVVVSPSVIATAVVGEERRGRRCCADGMGWDGIESSKLGKILIALECDYILQIENATTHLSLTSQGQRQQHCRMARRTQTRSPQIGCTMKM